MSAQGTIIKYAGLASQTWISPDVTRRYFYWDDTNKVIAAGASNPSTWAGCLRPSRGTAAGYRSWGLYNTAKWNLTAGSGAWTSMSPTTKSSIQAFAHINPDLGSKGIVTNLGGGTGMPYITNGIVGVAGAASVALTQAQIGKATIGDQEAYGGLCIFAATTTEADLCGAEAVGAYYGIEPNIAAPAGQTWRLDMEFWEVYIK